MKDDQQKKSNLQKVSERQKSHGKRERIPTSTLDLTSNVFNGILVLLVRIATVLHAEDRHDHLDEKGQLSDENR